MGIKQKTFLIFILVISTFLRFYNLMHDSPYFFDPDERNMANAVSQFRLPGKLSEIPNCLINQFSQPSTTNQQLTTNCNLNPHFFAYGQFPLYLAFASDQLTKPIINFVSTQPTTYNSQPASPAGGLITSFPSAIFWLRFYSALAGILTVLIVYLITKKLINSEFSYYTALITAFSPGLIQSAHFGTTESLLTFFFLASAYLSVRYLNDSGKSSTPLRTSLKFIILTSLVIGLALGSKLTGIFFFVPSAISLMIRITELLRKRTKKKVASGVFVYLVIGLLVIIGSIAVFALSSPYNLVDPGDFKSAVFGYESDVAMGRYDAFYTRQFVNTTPIIFQAEKIFPYTLGWLLFILGTMGFLLINLQSTTKIIHSILKKLQIKIYPSIKLRTGKLQINNKFNNLKIDNSFIILNLSFIIYFLPNAFLFAKWTRFMTPILPFFAIFSAFALSKSKNLLGYLPRQQAGWLIGLLVFISILPGGAFMSIYTHEDSRLQASYWIYQNIPANSYILSETANVIDIPLSIAGDASPSTSSQGKRALAPNEARGQDPLVRNYTVISFDFYHIDESPGLGLATLTDQLQKADYIFIPSRRIFANYARLPQIYPLVTKYYQLLNSGALGFEKVEEINSYPAIGPVKFPDEQAEETFTVFDHPVIRIYRKVKQYNQDQYRSLFS